MKKKTKRILVTILILLLAAVLFVAGINWYVISWTESRIRSADELGKGDADCILILGAGVRPDGTPSLMLRDRLLCGAELYEAGVADRILVSGDHSTPEYDEPGTMRRFLLEAGVPDEAILTDDGGLSTVESIRRAEQMFGLKRIVIVSQRYHLYRSLYLAEREGLEAEGVPALEVRYGGQIVRDLREVVARVKDVLVR